MLMDRLPAASTRSTRTLTLTDTEFGKNVTVRVESFGGRVSVESWIGDSFSRHATTTTPAKPVEPTEFVAVSFDGFSSPAEAAAYVGQTFTYEADASLNLTIGDAVEVPVNGPVALVATVTKLNETRPPNPVKRIIRVVKRAGC